MSVLIVLGFLVVFLVAVASDNMTPQKPPKSKDELEEGLKKYRRK